jgi:hypothetical protein
MSVLIIESVTFFFLLNTKTFFDSYFLKLSNEFDINIIKSPFDALIILSIQFVIAKLTFFHVLELSILFFLPKKKNLQMSRLNQTKHILKNGIFNCIFLSLFSRLF